MTDKTPEELRAEWDTAYEAALEAQENSERT